jgi:glycine C-acetyltransferase
VVAACIAALDVIADEPDRLERLWSNTDRLKTGLRELGFDTGMSETPITPVITGEEKATQTFSRRLFEEGVFCPAIVFPTVGKGIARVRTIVTADHTDDDVREALEVFERVGSELGLR